MRNILLRSAKSYFFLNEMNKKDLPAMTIKHQNAVECIAGKSFFIHFILDIVRFSVV